MGRLKRRERELLWLAYAQGSSHQEIGETLGLKTGSIKPLLFRARQKLAALLGAGRNRERAVRKHYCNHEQEVLTALKPSRLADALRARSFARTSTCVLVRRSWRILRGRCSTITSALVTQAQVPSSAIVWWRAQMRSRREAAQVVTQPMTFVQGLILACAAGLTRRRRGILRADVPARDRSGRRERLTRSRPSRCRCRRMCSPIRSSLPPAPRSLFCAIVLPLALYFTSRRNE